MNEIPTCSICGLLSWRPIILPCCHESSCCKHCISKSFLYKDQCPFCRQNLGENIGEVTYHPNANSGGAWKQYLMQAGCSKEAVEFRQREINLLNKRNYLIVQFGNLCSSTGVGPNSGKKKYTWKIFVNALEVCKGLSFGLNDKVTLNQKELTCRYIEEVRFNINPIYPKNFTRVKNWPFEFERSSTLDNIPVRITIIWKENISGQKLEDLDHVIQLNKTSSVKCVVKEISQSKMEGGHPACSEQEPLKISRKLSGHPNTSGKSKYKLITKISKRSVAKLVQQLSALYPELPSLIDPYSEERSHSSISNIKDSTSHVIWNSKQERALGSGMLITSFGKLFFQCAGNQGDPLVLFLHGSGMLNGSHVYEQTLHEMSLISMKQNQHFFFVALDCPGYGRSEGDKQYIRSYPLAVIQESLKCLQYSKAYALYGKSQGGAAMMHTLLENPSLSVCIIADRIVFPKSEVGKLSALQHHTLLIFDRDDRGHPIEVGRLMNKRLIKSQWVEYSSSKFTYWWGDNFPKLAIEFLVNVSKKCHAK